MLAACAANPGAAIVISGMSGMAPAVQPRQNHILYPAHDDR